MWSFRHTWFLSTCSKALAVGTQQVQIRGRGKSSGSYWSFQVRSEPSRPQGYIGILLGYNAV
jgi:hypothetical protein